MKNILILTNSKYEQSKQFINFIESLNEKYKISYKIYQISDETYNQNRHNEDSITFLYLSDEEIRKFLKTNLNKSKYICILPNEDNKKAQLSYGINDNIYKVFENSLNLENYKATDILLCNNEPVFTNIIIGEVHELNNPNIKKLSFLEKFKQTLKNLFNISYKDFTITTAKQQQIKTAATGIMVFEHYTKSGQYNIFNEDISIHDGKLNALILAPTSKISYLYYLLIIFIYNKFTMKKLPKSIGVIKTSKLNITSSSAIDYKVDNLILSAKEIEMEVISDAINISFDKDLSNLQNETKSENNDDLKESIKINYLPKGEMKELLLLKRIPIFKKASDEDFKELFLSVRENAKLTSIFLTLMILSTVLATTGLFQSSSPVIIGAMILAPLMSPIVSLSMGVVRSEKYLIKTSTKTLIYGILTALFFSCIYTYFIPLSYVTSEIQARLNPNILDLMVAIVAGIAGAYASAKSEVAKSLAGVAIAVALVPPLSVTGIGIGWGDFDIIYGSFLLFLTNLIGITLAASITFIVLGFAPIHRAKKGIVYTTILLVIVTIPLVLSFAKLIEQNSIRNTIKPSYFVNNKEILINIEDIDLSKNKPIIKVEALSKNILNSDDLNSLKSKLEENIQKNITLKTNIKVIIE